MKPGWLLLILAVTLLMDLAWRPVWAMGTATVDPPLLFVLWLALKRWRARAHFVLGLLAVVRWQLGVADLVESYVPAALAAELVILASPLLHLSHYPRGVAAVAVAVPLVVALELILTSGQRLPEVAVDATLAGGVAAVFALLLLPLLDAIEPLLVPRLW